MCGCFGNMCTCIYCVIIVRLCIFILNCFVCTSERTAATKRQLKCCNNNDDDDDNNNNNNTQKDMIECVPNYTSTYARKQGYNWTKNTGMNMYQNQ